MAAYSEKGKSWRQTKEKMSQGKNVRRRVARTDEQQEDKGEETFSHAKNVRSRSAQQRFLQDVGSLRRRQRADAGSSVKRECSVHNIEVKACVGETGRELASRTKGCKVSLGERGAKGDVGSHWAKEGRKERAIERRVTKLSSGKAGWKRGRKERGVESKASESLSGEVGQKRGGRGAQGNVKHCHVEGGCKEIFVEWRAAESSSRERGVLFS